jgi:hypothetical protein
MAHHALCVRIYLINTKGWQTYYLNYFNSCGADRKPMQPQVHAHRKGREERKAPATIFYKKQRTDTNLYEPGGAVLGYAWHTLGYLPLQFIKNHKTYNLVGII